MSVKLTARVLPRGFRYAGMHCGIKKSARFDLGWIVADAPCAAAGVFTTNRIKAAPVVLSQAHVRRAASRMRAVVVNSGNANCATGPAGMQASRKTSNRDRFMPRSPLWRVAESSRGRRMLDRYAARQAAADHGIAGAIVRDHGAALLRRIQFSYRPKQIALVEPGIPELAETLRQSGVEIVGKGSASALPAAPA